LPFLACHRSEEYDPIFKRWHLEGGDLAAIERERLAWDHAEVASWICSEWGLPENIAAAIRGHHGHSIEAYEPFGPVRLVAILREDDDNSGMEEMIAETKVSHGVSEEKMLAIIEPGFEKAKELARLII